MEVDDSGVRMPARHQVDGGVIVEWVIEVEKAGEVIACAHVVSWEYVQSAQTPQQHVLCGPASDAAPTG